MNKIYFVKRTVALITVSAMLFMCVFFTGCHSASTKEFKLKITDFDTSKNYEISFWAKNDTNKNQVEAYNNAVKGFEKLYPNVKVNIKFYTDYPTIYQDVITNIATDTTPNVCITYPDHVATYLTGNNIVVPLDELMSNEKYGFGGSELLFDSPTAEEIVPEYLKEGNINGKYYMLPFMRSTEACYINKTYVEKLGYKLPDMLTWDFIWEVSEKAALKDKNEKFLLNNDDIMLPFIYKSTDNLMIQALKQLNGDYSDENGNIKIFNNTTKDILNTVAKHTKSGAFSTFKVSGYPANFLNAGQCVFAIDSTAGSTWMGPKAPLSDISEDKIVDFEIAVRPVPQYDTAKPFMMSQGPSICIFNKSDSQEVLASWLFAQYLLTNEVQLSYSCTEGYIPVTLKAQQSDEYKEYLSLSGKDNDEHYSVKIDAVKMLLANKENTFVTPVFNGSTSLREASSDMIERVVKSVRRKETVDDAYYEKMFADIPVKFHFNDNKSPITTK